jgi:cell division protein FtsB
LSGKRRAGYIVAIGLVAAYGWIALRGPQGIQALISKHREIRQLEEQNAETARENERRREHIRRLKDSSSEQEMEIRKQLKLQRPGDTTFILPDAPKDPHKPTPPQ